MSSSRAISDGTLNSGMLLLSLRAVSHTLTARLVSAINNREHRCEDKRPIESSTRREAVEVSNRQTESPEYVPVSAAC